jgi:hypothetical protein
MGHEAEKNPQPPKQQQGQQDPTGSVNTPRIRTLTLPMKIRARSTVHRISPRRIHRRTAILSTKVNRNQKMRNGVLPDQFFWGQTFPEA